MVPASLSSRRTGGTQDSHSQKGKSNGDTIRAKQQDSTAHWVRKIANRKVCPGILDTSTTSGAGRPEDAELFEYTGQPSTKVFMLPDKSKVRATHKMLLKHKIREGAREMNIVPGLHSTLVSIPKMLEKDFIVVFDKKSAKTYDATTTTILATEQPILEAPRCTSTGLWLMPLDADGDKEHKDHHNSNIERENASNIGGASETAMRYLTVKLLE